MKLLISICLCFLLVGCHSSKHNDRDTIQRVFDQRREAIEHARNPQRAVSLRQFYVGLDSINVSDCPSEFRVAWTKYVQTSHRFNDGRAGRVLFGLIGYAMTETPMAPVAALKAGHDAKVTMTEAFYEVSRIGARYGAATKFEFN